MRYHALACDYDNTLASEGMVAGETLALLERLLATGRKLVLVTGRELDDMLRILPEITLFHRVVAENGALLYDPAARAEKALTPPVPEAFVQALRERGVRRCFAGRVIISTQRPEEHKVLAVIRDMGIELQTSFNRGAVVVLPAGVNKATGLTAALESLSLSAHEVVDVGDAENDHAFLTLCEFSVAVANALPALREYADWVTTAANGAGMGELIEEWCRRDQRVGLAVGGRPLEASARAGLPEINRLQPLLPDTRSVNRCRSSSIHSPMVVPATLAPGSICHHLQSLQSPHPSLMKFSSS
jgi:HAD superfamily hydrolase (TIGR01484 family)